MKAKPEQATQKAVPVTEVTEHSSSELAPAWVHDPNTWITLSFVIFIVLALRYLKPFIAKSLDERSAKIREQLEQASRLRAEAEELLATYRAQQAQLLKEAESLIETAKRDAEQMRIQAAEELKASLARRGQQAQEKIARAEAEAIAQIRTHIVESATAAARDMLASKAAKDDTVAIDRALSLVEKRLA